MNAPPLLAAPGGQAMIAAMILLIAVAFVVVVWVMANRHQKTRQATKTKKDETK